MKQAQPISDKHNAVATTLPQVRNAPAFATFTRTQTAQGGIKLPDLKLVTCARPSTTSSVPLKLPKLIMPEARCLSDDVHTNVVCGLSDNEVVLAGVPYASTTLLSNNVHFVAPNVGKLRGLRRRIETARQKYNFPYYVNDANFSIYLNCPTPDTVKTPPTTPELLS